MRHISGTHLLVDAYVESASCLTAENIVRVLDTVVTILGMKRLADPIICTVPIQPDLVDSAADDGGVSVILPITTSHLSAHAWPERRAIMLDVFSCRTFSTDVALQELSDGFRFTRDVRHHVVQRRDPRRDTLPQIPALRQFPWTRGS